MTYTAVMVFARGTQRRYNTHDASVKPSGWPEKTSYGFTSLLRTTYEATAMTQRLHTSQCNQCCRQYRTTRARQLLDAVVIRNIWRHIFVNVYILYALLTTTRFHHYLQTGSKLMLTSTHVSYVVIQCDDITLFVFIVTQI